MQNFLNTGFDLEVVPSKDDAVMSRIKETVSKQKITAPDLDKAGLAAALEITEPKMIKELSASALKQLWVEKFEPQIREELFDKAWKKSCFESVTGEIVSSAVNVFGQTVRGVYFRSDTRAHTGGEKIDDLYTCFQSEIDILNNTVELFDKLHDWAASVNNGLFRLVGLNIYGFDIKYFCQRCMINGAKLPKFSLMLSNYDSIRQLDLNVMWNCGERIKSGYPGFMSLESLCWALGVENPKVDDLGDIHGKDVCDIYYRDGDVGALRIAKYNLRDVISYEKCFDKMKGILG